MYIYIISLYHITIYIYVYIYIVNDVMYRKNAY